MKINGFFKFQKSFFANKIYKAKKYQNKALKRSSSNSGNANTFNELKRYEEEHRIYEEYSNKIDNLKKKGDYNLNNFGRINIDTMKELKALEPDHIINRENKSFKAQDYTLNLVKDVTSFGWNFDTGLSHNAFRPFHSNYSGVEEYFENIELEYTNHLEQKVANIYVSQSDKSPMQALCEGYNIFDKSDRFMRKEQDTQVHCPTIQIVDQLSSEVDLSSNFIMSTRLEEEKIEGSTERVPDPIPTYSFNNYDDSKDDDLIDSTRVKALL